MRIAVDQFVDGARPAGPIEQRQCIELRSADGSAWVQISLEGEEPVPADGKIIAEDGAIPRAVALVANPSGAWQTVPLPPGAQISARPGWPRLVIG